MSNMFTLCILIFKILRHAVIGSIVNFSTNQNVAFVLTPPRLCSYTLYLYMYTL